MMDTIFGLPLNEVPNLMEFMNNMADSVYIIDEHGRFIFINNAVEAVEGFRNEEVAGKTIWQVYEQFADTPLMQVLRTHNPVREFAYSYTVNGNEVHQSCRAFPVFNNGKFGGAYAIQRDITSMKKIIEENFSLHEKLENYQSDRRLEKSSSDFGQLIGEHPLFLQCIQNARLAAKGDSSVLLTGSTGSGKEVFARSIHEASARKLKPFLAINCAAIPETLLESILFGTSRGAYTGAMEKKGLFEQAEGGTLFLDEINSMPLISQAKLLRVLEEKKVRHLGAQSEVDVDVRIISSSNVNAEEAIEKKLIREDLFYRLSVVNIIIPDLSHRKSDILLLTKHFIADYNVRFNRQVKSISDNVKQIFLNYSWPGNVRQLKHCIEAAMNFVVEEEEILQEIHIPDYVFNETLQRKTEQGGAVEINIFDAIEQEEKKEIEDALKKCRGNVTRSAEHLGISRQMLIYRMRKYKISKR